MNKIVLGLGAATLIASAGVAVAQDRQAGGERGHMAKIDSNGDGQITRAEMLAGVDAMFARGDVNQDGKLDKADREARRAAMKAKMWDRLDADNDGSVSKAEYDAAGAERAAKRAARMAEMKERRAERGAEAGARDGERRSGHRMHRGKRGGMAMGMLRQADSNGDQAITLAEARAAAAKHFDMIDADRNGVATKQEMQAMHAAHKAERKPQAD